MIITLLQFRMLLWTVIVQLLTIILFIHDYLTTGLLWSQYVYVTIDTVIHQLKSFTCWYICSYVSTYIKSSHMRTLSSVLL